MKRGVIAVAATVRVPHSKQLEVLYKGRISAVSDRRFCCQLFESDKGCDSCGRRFLLTNSTKAARGGWDVCSQTAYNIYGMGTSAADAGAGLSTGSPRRV